jgi:hypothetical protein
VEVQDEVERLLDFTNGDGTNVALASLVRIVGDSAATVRQRLKAAGAVLGYKVHDDSAAEFTKRYLQSVCTSADVATDYRIEAGELLRRHEAPRVTSETVRPSYCDSGGSEAGRIAAWRSYTIKQRQWKLAIETRDVPHWSQWAADLYADEYIPPPGWPPWS